MGYTFQEKQSFIPSTAKAPLSVHRAQAKEMLCFAYRYTMYILLKSSSMVVCLQLNWTSLSIK